MKRDYFAEDCPTLAECLEKHFDRMRTVLRTHPEAEEVTEALVLGGGYGRGEGGVLRSDNGDPQLFNDLDYFLFSADPGNPALQAAVHALEQDGRRNLGIDVDIKCLDASDVRDPSRTMMFCDLASGHKVIIGDDDYLTSRWKSPDPTRIPKVEASRLLWNRGTGLYFANCRIAKQREPEFVIRNHQKFKLAAGDALLALDGRYHGSVGERLRRFEEKRPDIPLGFHLIGEYRDAVDFKLRPQPCEIDDDEGWRALADENRELASLWTRLFLHIESVRLGKTFAEPSDYVAGWGRRSPEVPIWKTPFFAIRDFFKYRRWLAPLRDYPRSALFRSLFCLLSDDRIRDHLPSPGKFLAPTLSAGPDGNPNQSQSWESIYQFWWERYG